MDIHTAKQLSTMQTIYAVIGDPFFNRGGCNSNGSAMRFTVTSVKTWKTRPDEVEVRLKRGLRDYIRIREDKLYHFSLTEQTK